MHPATDTIRLAPQVGAERYNIFTGFSGTATRSATLILRGGAEQVRACADGP
jgi:hypothetical protein